MNRSQLRKRLMIIAKHTNNRLNGSTPQSLAATLLRSDPGLKRIAPARHQLWRHLLLLATGMVLLAGCGKAHQGHTAAQRELPTAQVLTQTVEAKPLARVEDVVGTVRARLRATIEAKTSGRITDLPVVLGQKVKAGELLARLDAPEIKARLDQAEATLQQAERDSKRLSSLLNQQAVSRADSEAADSRYLVAKGVVAEVRAMMGYVEIHAPFDGVVTKKWVEDGKG